MKADEEDTLIHSRRSYEERGTVQSGSQGGINITLRGLSGELQVHL